MPEPVESTEPIQSVDESKSEILQTVNQSISDLGDGVRELVAAMKDGAPEAWRIMVLHQQIEAWRTIASGIAVIVVTLILFSFIGRFITKWKRELAEEESDENQCDDREIKNLKDVITGWHIGRVLVAGVIIVATIMIVLADGVAERLINPEYYAAKDLITTMHNAKCH